MEQEEIKKERIAIEGVIKSLKREIRLSENQLLELQKKCKHPGAKLQPGPETERFCSDCGWFGKK